MNVLHIVAEMDPAMGGICQAVRTIAAGLAQLGVQNEIVSLDDPTAAFLAEESCPVHALGPGTGPWFYGARLLPWLNEHIVRFDAVVVHGLWLYHSYATNKAFQRLRNQPPDTPAATGRWPRLFVMPHGMLDPYFQQATGRKLKAVRNWAYWKLLENKLINNAAALLFTCEEEHKLAQETFRPYHPQRTIVVGLGVKAPPPYSPAMREALLSACPGLEQPYLLFLSRIHEKKGVDLLLSAYCTQIEALTSARRQLVDMPITASSTASPAPQLLIAGPGLETPYGRQQQAAAVSLVLGPPVVFPGMLTGAAKWGAFYGCEAFILPSHQENFGIAVVEALACGKPVLISNRVNIWREIAAAGGGIIADDTLTGIEQLLEKWQHLLPAQRQAMELQAQACFLSNFAVEPAANRMLAALTK